MDDTELLPEVRKRPLNNKEMARKEDDIVTVVQENALLTVHEPKVKVDLTAYVEKHEFCFDAVLDENVTSDEVYRMAVELIIPTIFQRTKATCSAYAQTGSGKTYTMQPLPLRAVEDFLRLLNRPVYRNERFKLWLSYFEIYGGKLFDLLSNRKKLCMREDGRQQVCIVGLQEFEVSDVQVVKDFIERESAARSTGANEESSRSHAILQLVVKKHPEVKDSKRNNDGNEFRNGKVVGKISFIDLAGSERGADTTDNDRQRRVEGAEINKSLLALKECSRALDNDQLHIPFRGSKLTEVLGDSFVGNSKTVMISCFSPSAGSCEHTLNTLRYADRVSLSKSGNSKKEQAGSFMPPAVKEVFAAQPLFASADIDDTYEQLQESGEYSTNYNLNRQEESPATSSSLSMGQKVPSTSYIQYSANAEEKVQRVSPPRRKAENPHLSVRTSKQPTENNSNTSYGSYEPNEPEPAAYEDNIKDILEEEEALIAAHRKVIEDTMESVREEMKLLAEVDRPGSLIDNYVTQLNIVLLRKAAGLGSLQSRLSRFQQLLKQQEILTRKRVPR